MAKVVLRKNPFRPQLDQQVISVRAGTRLDTMLRAQALVSGRGRMMVRNEVFIVQVNGDYLLADQWARRIRNEDVVVVCLLPGDGGGSNPLRIVLTVALAVAAAYTGGAAAAAYAGATGAAATSAAALAVGALASAVVMIGGGMLLNALLPPPKPNAMQAREKASPTYTIGAQGNTARLMEAIPVLYGRHLIYPDFAAQPYTEIDSNQVYLYQLFCISQGDVDIEQIRIEETDIDNFAEVRYQIVKPGQRVTLFPDNVVTSTAVQGLELKSPNEGGVFLGPFVANPAGTKTNQIAVDIVFPKGLFYANDEGGLDSVNVSWEVQVREIDDNGDPASAWQSVGIESYSNATNTTQMRTYRYDVDEGRYEVRARKTSNAHNDARYGETVQWAGMRAYLPSQSSYGNLTMLAVVMRATNNLNQSTARRINVIGTRKLKKWDPVNGWSASESATRSPAWAFADVLANTEYGKGMLDSRVNLNEIYRLAQVWDSRGDTFDGVFDTTISLWEALSRIARVGRATPMYYAGVVDIVRNEPRTVQKAMFTPRNIVEGTFSLDYKFVEHDSPDHVIVEIVNEDTWQPDEVKCVLPGGTDLRPYRLQLPGVINRAQAWREGISMAAANRDQRRFVQLSTELEGNIPKYSDLAGITHDVPKWGLSGFIVAYDESSGTLTTSEPLEWWPGENHYIGLHARDGSIQGPYRVTQGADEFTAILASSPDIYVSDGATEEFTTYQFGPGEKRALAAQVLSTLPDENDRVALTFVNYAESVHIAENGGEVPPPAPPSLLPVTPNAPVVDEVTVYAAAVPGEQVVSCTPARGATAYEFEASNDSGATWTPLGSNTVPNLRIRLPAGPWWVRARGVGAMPGPWKTWQGLISATMLPPPELSSFTASALIFGIRLAWAWQAAPGLKYIEIYESATANFNNATLMGLFPLPRASYERTGLSAGKVMYFWARLRDEADQAGPWFGGETGVQGQAASDASDYLDYFDGLIGADQLASDVTGRLDGLDTSIADNTQAIQQEAQDRADAVLNEKLEREAAIQTEQTLRQSADDSLAQQIATVAAGTGEQFDTRQIWYFDSSMEGWYGNGAPTVSNGWLRPANNADAWVASPASLTVEGDTYKYAKMRVRRTGMPPWEGRLYWRGVNDTNFDPARSMTLPEPTFDASGITTVDFKDIEWPATVIQIRLDLTSNQTATDFIEYDWIAVGRPSPGASAAALQDEKLARISGDAAEAANRQTLAAQMRGNYTGTDIAQVTQGLVYSERQARASGDSANAQDIQALQARMPAGSGKLATQASVTTEANARVSADEALSGRTGVLEARMPAGSGKLATQASVATEEQARAHGDQALAEQVTELDATWHSDTYGDLTGDEDTYAGDQTTYAGTKTVLSAYADGDQALSQRIDAQVAQIDEAAAMVQQTATAMVALDGSLKATWSIQAEVTEDGKTYAAGMALGAYKEPGQAVQTSIYYLADRFAFLNLANGQVTTPFVIQGGQVFIRQALIGASWITNAMIGNIIQSDDFVDDVSGWQINKNGTFQMNGTGSGSERTAYRNDGLRVFAANGTEVVTLGKL